MLYNTNMPIPGSIALIGSGETSATGRQVYETLWRDLPAPITVNILETPAGFELNSPQVAGRVAEFIRLQLQNWRGSVNLIPARARGSSASPDDPEIVEPLYTNQMTFLGPGSPSYAVRQLTRSLAWEVIRASQRAGTALVFASAAAVACGTNALPVYEIFKVGEDPHWKPGLNLLSTYGLEISFIPHWNNSEGGPDLDTSHCFIGKRRFEALLEQIKPGHTVLGLDEHTAVILDLAAQRGQVIGNGQVHILREGQEQLFTGGENFSILELGPFQPLNDPWQDIPTEIARRFQQQAESQAVLIPEDVQLLIDARQKARETRNWSEADRLRQEILDLGWTLKDTPSGPQAEKFK
jgi:hypothetical protein